jgi:beta-glucosidase-like glycosyl hydrolase
MSNATKNTKAVKAPAELQVLPVTIQAMTAKQLTVIAQSAIDADSALGLATSSHGATYAACAASLRSGIDTGLTSNLAVKEYLARVNNFATLVSTAFLKPYKGEDKSEVLKRKVEAIKKGVTRDNFKALWVSPKPELSQSEAATIAREKDAKRKEEERAVKAKIAALKKTMPKADEKELIKIAKADVKAESREMREESKASANDARILTQGCEMLAAFSLRISEQCEVDTDDVQAKIAALVIAIQAITPKA